MVNLIIMKKSYAVGCTMVALQGFTCQDSVPAHPDGKYTGTSIPQPPPANANMGADHRHTTVYKRLPNKVYDLAWGSQESS